MRATHTLHHDDRNGAGTMVTLGDIVEMIDVFEGEPGYGLTNPATDQLVPRLDAPITAVVRSDNGVTCEGRIERLIFHLKVGPGAPAGGDSDG